MSEQTFAVGTEVFHKSGGPRMVVAGFGRYGMAATQETYKCRWFNEKNQVQEDTFLPEELKPAPEPQRGSRIRYATSSKGL